GVRAELHGDKTPLDYPIAAARGFHYCQLLSPAAAMEWICIDGLRLRASCSGRLFVYGPIGGLDRAAAYFGRSLARQTRTTALLRRLTPPPAPSPPPRR
ncbi:MAG: hypothetical protein ACKOCA_03740, partial [Vulcanococcus sp.]